MTNKQPQSLFEQIKENFLLNLKDDILPLLYDLMIKYDITRIDFETSSFRFKTHLMNMNAFSDKEYVSKQIFILNGYKDMKISLNNLTIYQSGDNALKILEEMMDNMYSKILYLKTYKQNMLTKINNLSALNDTFERILLLEKMIQPKQTEPKPHNRVVNYYNDNGRVINAGINQEISREIMEARALDVERRNVERIKGLIGLPYTPEPPGPYNPKKQWR